MEHLYERDNPQSATPFVAHRWAGEDSQTPGKIQTGIRYKKTRSTLAVDAMEVFDLDKAHAETAISSLLRLCKIVGRDEIVIECLENLATDDSNQWISDFFSSVQNDIVQTCRKIDFCSPRVALEKRREHFDLRIYLSCL